MGIFSLFRRKERLAERHPMGVRFDPKRVTPKIKSEIKRLVYNDPRIERSIKRKAYALSLQSVVRGRDLRLLTSGLIEMGMDKRAATEFSVSLNNRCSAMMRIASETSLGITHGIWRFSGVPCFIEVGAIVKAGYEVQSEEHQRADGQKFPLKTGYVIAGVHTWPGSESGCRCIWIAAMPWQ
ncbi:hypothetical protein [Novosphingobium colocasiae]|uniref:hypothetical protein n=1 Tax=Novosphingobium colocasiae TaxID=1256513 RepID=UPI0035AE29AE